MKFKIITALLLICCFIVISACRKENETMSSSSTLAEHVQSTSGQIQSNTAEENPNNVLVNSENSSIIVTGSESNITSEIIIENKSELNVLDFGVDNTDKLDNTDILTKLHNTGKKIYYPNGIYRFNGKTLNLNGGVRFQSQNGVIIRNNISDMNIIRFDDFGNLIGLMQNHLEKHIFSDKSGTLVSPPLSTKKYNTKADLIAYWYNDFGLTAGTGWTGWKTWSWNHHDAANDPDFKNDNLAYNSSLHPLLGFYYGDDPIVLDWQCYWLYEYGVKNVALISTDLEKWEQEGARDHWVYELFHNTPNFKNLKYTAFVETPYGKNEEYVRNAWKNTLEKIYFTYNNYYLYNINGNAYPVINLFDEKALVSVFGTTEKVKSFYIEIAHEFMNKGFNGVVMLTNNPISFNYIQSDTMKNEGVVRYDCTYVANFVPSDYLNGQYSYADVVNYFSPKTGNTVIGIATSMQTQSPHPSQWKCTGSNPADFERWLNKATDFLNANKNAPQMLTCYNVSEWGEGGTGLVPTVKNGFSYLEAIKKVIVK